MLKILVTGASGYIAKQLIPAFRERYELVLIDVSARYSGHLPICQNELYLTS